MGMTHNPFLILVIAIQSCPVNWVRKIRNEAGLKLALT